MAEDIETKIPFQGGTSPPFAISKRLDLGTVPATLIPDGNEANENYATNDIASGAHATLDVDSPDEPTNDPYEVYPDYTTGANAGHSAFSQNPAGAMDGQTTDFLN